MRRKSIVALLFLLALPALAQKHPNIELGFNAERLYHFTDLDSVNMYNGNLVLQIPIGSAYPANASFQYRFTLVYNSKIWDYERNRGFVPGQGPGDGEYVYAEFNRRSNAGLGWRLSLGRLIEPSDPGTWQPDSETDAWVYEDASGAEHPFGAIRENETAGKNDAVSLSLDTTGLRMVRIAEDERRIEFPSGEIHTFRKERLRWHLREMRDRFGNKLEIRPEFVTNAEDPDAESDDPRVARWIITDSVGRSHVVTFVHKATTEYSWDVGQHVATIVLQTADDKQSTWRFHYETPVITWGCGHNPPPEPHSIAPEQAKPPLLTRLTLPDQTTFELTYYEQSGEGCSQGALKSMTLPTKGTIEYAYDESSLPQSYCVASTFKEITPAVVKKTIRRQGAADETWDYKYTLAAPIFVDDVAREDCDSYTPVPDAPFPAEAQPRWRWARGTVLTPLYDHDFNPQTAAVRDRTDSYFYTDTANHRDESNPPGFHLDRKLIQFGQPMTPEALPDEDAGAAPSFGETGESAGFDPGDGEMHFLSTRQFEACDEDGTCPAGPATTRPPKRSTYLRYPPPFQYDPTTWRYPVQSTITRYHDDPGCSGGCWVRSEQTEDDGVHKFRKSEISTSNGFLGGFRTFTGYRHWTPDDIENPGEKWILNIYDRTERTEGAVTAVSLYQFSPIDGFLQGVRTRVGDITGPNDLLTRFQSDGFGNVLHELAYGGHGQAIPTEPEVPVMSGTPQYLTRNTYSHGLLAKTERCIPAISETCDQGGSLLTIVDVSFHESGAPDVSRDPSGVETKYSYDASSRLESVDPPGPAKTTYQYIDATPATHARVVEALATSGTTVSTTTYEFDGLGRVCRVSKSLPDGGVSVAETIYDPLGRKREVSEPFRAATHPDGLAAVSDPGYRTKTQYDFTGRPLKIESPDKSVVTFVYRGDREAERTSYVATPLDDNTPTVTTETYDAQRRLRSVVEKANATSAAQPDGGDVTATYGYDVGGRLTTVQMNATGVPQQNRSFVYDLRGFLLSETHPENGTTTYAEHDARGKAGKRIDANGTTLSFTYDAADRLTTVAEGTKRIKEFEFAKANQGTNLTKGKLINAVRYNDISAGTIVVTEKYDYDTSGANSDNAAGQMSKRTTIVERLNPDNSRTPIQTFEYGVRYDDLQLPKTVLMPTCPGCPTVNGLSTVTYGRTAGYLTSIQDFASLAYHPSGMVKTVTHASTPQAVDTYSIDQTTGMSRPSAIQFSGGTCPVPAPSVISAGAVCPGSTGSASVPPRTGITHTWRIDSGGTLTSSPVGNSITFQPDGSSSVTLTVTATNTCNASVQSSKTVTLGSAPSAPTMTVPVGVCTNGTGQASVDAQSGVTHSWTITGGTLTSSATGETVTFLAGPSGVVTLTVMAASACGTSSASKDVPVAPTPTATVIGATQAGMEWEIEAALTGIGPWTIQWSDGTTETVSESPTTRIVRPLSDTTYTILSVTGAFGCAGTASGSVTIDVPEQSGPSPTQSVFAYQRLSSIYAPWHAVRLWIQMDPPPGPDHSYTFKWYGDEGTDTPPQLNGSVPEMWVQPEGLYGIYRVEITGVHKQTDGTTRTEVTYSPRMYVYRYGTCELPPVRLEQTATNVPEGTPVTFTAVCDWPDIDYQWYEGQSGDTRRPVAADPGRPDRLTVQSGTVRPYWVRASRDCGEFTDGPTVTFTSGSCAPALITRQPEPATVSWGGNTTLSVAASSSGTSSFSWYEGPGETSSVGTDSAYLALQNVRKSARYHVTVSSAACGNSADSAMATVRVASCSTITPPAQWPTEVWTDLNTPATLSVTAGGATGYQWFGGDVGDETGLIPNGTLATYVTEALTEESRYWVRIFGSDGCIVDSPTITVKLCEKPRLKSTPSFDQNIVSGQWAAFSVNMAGTDLQYQWYEGLPGDTSKPVGMPVDKLMVRPLQTARYWVKVTARCGSGGSDPQPWDPAPDPVPVFTASICPVLQPPVAAKTTVMNGATTTLSIAAEGTELTYQWYRGASGDKSNPVAGGGTATITTPPLTQTTTFWCEVKSGTCVRSSEPVVVSLCQLPNIGWSPQNKDKVTKDEFQFLRLTGVPTEEQVTYAWYEGQAGDTSHPITSQPAPGISPAQTTTYWARVTMVETGCYVDLPPFTVKVCIPTITAQPAASSILDKTSNPVAYVRLTVGVDIPGVTYQWYVGQPGNIASPIAVATASAYDASPSTDTTYWVRVTGSCEITRDSAAASVIVCQPPAITSHPASKVTVAGFTTDIEVTATGTELSYQWYKGASGDTSTPFGSNTREQAVTPSVTTDYWVRVTGRCGAVNSNTARFSVPPTITAHPVGGPITSGTTRTLSVVASGTWLSYQWYTLSGSTSTPIAGATGATFTTPPLTADTTYFCRVFSGAAYRDSDPATLTVCQPRAATVAPWTSVSGAEATLTISNPAPGEESYEWYRGQTGDVSAPLGIGSTKTVYPLETTWYWARTKRTGCDADSAAVKVTVCYPKITAQPQSGVIASGTQKTLTVAATGTPPLTYQWYIGPKGATTNPIAGATGPSYTTPSLSAATTYWARVTSPQQTCGTHHVDSDAATVTVCNTPAITYLTPARFIQYGSSAQISVTATGSNLTYQWYTGASGVTTNPVTNGTGASINVSPAANTSYWVRIVSEGLCATSSAAVPVDVCTTPPITAQPQSQTIRDGQSATLSVTTSAAGATYRWYQGAPGTVTTPLGTASTQSVTPTADTQYWVRITRGACTADSAGATITVCKLTASVASVNAASGQNAILTANATNARGPLTWNWYRGNSGDTSTPAGYGQQIGVVRTSTTNYWVRVSDGTCTVDSNTATLNICIPTITAQPQSTMVNNGQSATLGVTATGSPLTYQWYIGDSGVTTSPISGATSASYTTPALTSTTKYWVRVTGCAVANSATATVTVCVPPSAPAPTGSGSVPGSNATVSIAAGGTGLTYQWYKGQSGDTTRPISGATSATYAFIAQSSEYYWVRVSGTCGTANSPAVLHSVTPTITAQPQSIAVPEGSSATLSVTATGNFLTYQWYKQYLTQPVAGATAATFVTPPITGSAQYFVRVFSGTKYTTSDVVSVTICSGPSVSFTASPVGSSWNLRVNRLNPDDPELEYQWYIGTPGNPAQSTPQGGLTSMYYKTVDPPAQQTWWVRVWFIDHSCYTDTYGRTIQ